MKNIVVVCIFGCLAAADVPLGEPQRLDVHADGALLTWRLDMPAGDHRVELPYALTAELRVSGAAWSVTQETVAGAANQPHAAVPALVNERNALGVQLSALAGRRSALERETVRLRTLLAAAVARGSTDGKAWQASLDAVVAECTALDRLDAEHAVARTALLAKAESLMGTSAWLNGISEAQPLGVGEVNRALAKTAIPVHFRRILHVSSVVPATVLVTAVVHDVRWTPAAHVLVANGTARLVRQARLQKPAAMNLAALPVTVTSQPLMPILAGPEPRPVRIISNAVNMDSRRRVEQTASSGDWGQQASAPAASSPAASGLDAPAAREVAAPIPPPASPIDVEPGRAVRWDLGAVALPVDEVTIVVDRPSQPLVIVCDEWAIAPAISPVALRRFGVRVDEQPLLAGPLTLVLEGTVVATQSMSMHPPGAVLTLRAGEDAAIFAEPAVAWSIPATEQSEKRRRDGHTLALRNFAEQARTVALYQTMPVSRSVELIIHCAEATTAGFTLVQPGLLRWDVTLAPGERREFALGWTLNASGGLKL